MEDDVACVREEALILDATSERIRELVTKFRLGGESPVAHIDVPALAAMFAA
jgi:hypothetical protein